LGWGFTALGFFRLGFLGVLSAFCAHFKPPLKISCFGLLSLPFAPPGTFALFPLWILAFAGMTDGGFTSS
jgi:hypothetical protein